ncbi:unnamed protein product [Paramecium sonneborni]|uniref:DNA topoisomerase (ATP-hydrolyzing) n=1 Tax=Paramecium sonneborni TaxID=65129 RepID=A0A8S1MIL1_9CILI|nr:unnamed protein product [Paramecium sonneborni]
MNIALFNEEMDKIQKSIKEPSEIIDVFKQHLDSILEMIINKQASQELKFQSLKDLCHYLIVMRESLDGILKDSYHTKREIFYMNQNIFQKQENLNLVIKQFSHNVQIQRKQLHIISASKGLVCGSLILRKQDIKLDLLQLTSQGKGLNITEFMNEWQPQIYGKWILLVEKETVYFHLINEMHQEFLQNTVLITGKGYPCYATKYFVKYLSMMNPSIPVYYFGDMDPHGYDILQQYAYGNQYSSHELNNIPWIQWLNSYFSIVQFQIKKKNKLNQREIQLLEQITNNPNIPENWKSIMDSKEKYEIEDILVDNLSKSLLEIMQYLDGDLQQQ